jgi:predicted ATPase
MPPARESEYSDATIVAGVPAERSFAAGRYVVRQVLPEGGQKTVYLVHDTALDRECALALIRTELLEADNLERLRREAQAMARLDHPNIVAVHDIGEEDGRPFFVCQYITGGDLRGELRGAGGPLPTERALSIAEDLCRALAYAHEHGIVHRDVKPGNIWLTGDGTAKLGDFGLAAAADHSRLTVAGTFVGTAAYMAPEQALGQPADARSDLYALGCVVYELLTGRPPFLGDDALVVISQHINTAPVAPSWHNPEVPQCLDALVLRLLAKAPDDRPASATAVLDELGRVAAAGVPTPTRTASAEPRGDLAGVEWGRFVGRGEEMDGLKDTLEDALSGKGSMVMLVGEPGIGKSRLAEEFGVYARLRGAQVLVGRGYEGDSSLPYTPFIEALRQYTRSRPNDELRAELGPGAPEIATFVSELRARFPDIEEAPKLDGEAERLRLFASVTEFLHNAAIANPVVLFLDDLHWADKPSLLLLQHVAQRTARDRLLIVGAYRDVELDRTHPLADALGALRRLPNYRRVLLRGLPRESVKDMLTAIDPSEEGAAGRQALAAAVYQETEGNPFFIREVMAHLIETGKIVHEHGRWVGQVTSISELGIPEGVREVVGRRLSRLSEGCNRMLTLASTMAGGFSWDALKAICDEPEAELLDLLEEALRAQLIAERRGEGGLYDFTHALIRQTLYEELSTPRRVLLHRQIGEALEQLYAANVEPHLAELAHHFYESAPGGDVEKAIDYARRAGDRFLSLVAWEEAASQYERALQAMDLTPEADEQLRIDVLLALGHALSFAGAERERWRAVFSRGAELARLAGDRERYARAALGFAELLPNPGVIDAEVVRLLEDGLQLQGPGESALRAKMLARLGNELSLSSQRERAKELLADALQMARRFDDPEMLAFVLANHMWLAMDAVQALDLAREQAAAARRSGDKFAELRAHQQVSSYALILGDRDSFDRIVEEEEERLQRELRIVDYWTGLHHALQAQMDGQFDEAGRIARQAFAELRHENPDNAAQGLGVAMLELRRHQGRLPEMEPAIKVAAEQYTETAGYRAALALVYSSDVRRRDDARTVFDELAKPGFSQLPSDAILPVTLSYLAEVCWVLGDAARAPELYRMLLPREGECVVAGWANTALGAASRSLAILAATMSRWEDAERHFEDAVRMNEHLRGKPWLAHTRAQYADMLLRRNSDGDRDRAVALLQAALDAAQEMGMKHLIEDCLALKAQARDMDHGSV